MGIYRELEEEGESGDERLVHVERRAQRAIVTLDEPDRLNALSARMVIQVKQTLAELVADPAIRTVVLTGAGRGFSAGGDLRMMRLAEDQLGVPAWVLAAVTRRPRATSPPHRPLAKRSCSGRLTGISDDTRNLLTHASFRASRRRYGAVMEPMRVFAHHPKVMVGYAALELASERSRLVSARLKHLAELRAGMICGCEWCLDFGSLISAEAGIGEEDLRELPTYQRSFRFTELEKLVLDYATGMTRSPVAVSDALFDRLREQHRRARELPGALQLGTRHRGPGVLRERVLSPARGAANRQRLCLVS